LILFFLHGIKIDMTCNSQKSVCMIFNPKNRNKVINTSFPNFKLGSSLLHFVIEFKYLGHMITNDLTDDVAIQREIRSMFVSANILA
jgi:hypothetical protein